jgi:alpha-tubulin suppressor-like RCC1 family protein
MVERFSNGGCTQVSCGDRYTIVLNENGSVYVFGKASYNRLGLKC